MNTSLRDPEGRRRLADEAAEWLFRLEDGSAEDKRAFVRWLKNSKDAADEVLLAKSTDILLHRLLRDGSIDLAELRSDERNVIALAEGVAAPDGSHAEKEGLRQANAVKRRVPRWAGILGAGAAIAAVLTMVFIAPSFMPQWLHPNVYVTSIGEQRAIELVDGSAISINAKSRLRVAYSEHAREVYLESGQAMFTVAKDAARPFRVHVGGSIVQAIGTKFDIRRRAERINVAVVEGTVQITADVAAARNNMALAELAAATQVSAGEGVSVAGAGHITPPMPINVADVSAWQQRRLVFADNTLAEIAEEFGRFNRTPHLRIEGEALRARRFSGVFDADAPEALLVYLSADDTIAFDRQDDEIVIRPRPIIVQSTADAP